MKVINVHKRVINQPKEEVSKLLKTLATQDDKIWPNKKWPAIRFKDGLVLGAKGGHGIIRYTITNYVVGEHIKFQFTKPKGFYGTHEFNIVAINSNKVEINHIIKMNTSGLATFSWLFAIRWLHDALTEDALDKIENQFSEKQIATPYSVWVKILRAYFKIKRKVNT